MALVGELLKNRISTTVFLRRDSKRNSHVTDWFSKELAQGLLKTEYVSLEELSGYMCSAADSEGGIFYHLGWSGTFGAQRNDASLQQKNVDYTLDAVRLAGRLGCEHFIGVGSQAEYGRFEGRLTPETGTFPENEYGRAKLAAGIESGRLCGELGIRHSWVRVLSVYGPFDGKDTMIMSVIRGLLSGNRVSLTGGEQVWNYLYSGDAARALFMLGASQLNSESRVYCLAGAGECELKEYILTLCRLAGADEKLLDFGDIPYSDRQVMHLTADIGRIKDDCGFVPMTNFEDGIEKTIEWVRTYGIPLYGY